MFVRAINILLVIRREKHENIRFPMNGLVYRGGGLGDAHKGFYTVGKSFRVAGFLATSFQRKTADFFMEGADRRNEPCVLWVIKVDPRGLDSVVHRCKHVSYVENTNVKGEEEYLFAPYSPFTVQEVSAFMYVCMYVCWLMRRQ